MNRLRDGPYHIEPYVPPTDADFNRRMASHSPYDRSFGTGFDDAGHSRSLSLSQDHTRSPAASVASPSSTAPPNTPPAPAPPNMPLVPPQRPLSSEVRGHSQVYVVHHDSGRAPVTVYGPDGTEVVELPPRYVDSGGSTVGSSSIHGSATGAVPPLQVQDRRQPSISPPKGPRRIVN